MTKSFHRSSFRTNARRTAGSKKRVGLRAVYTYCQVPSRKTFPIFTLTSSVDGGAGGGGGREGQGHMPSRETLDDTKQRYFKNRTIVFTHQLLHMDLQLSI